VTEAQLMELFHLTEAFLSNCKGENTNRWGKTTMSMV